MASCSRTTQKKRQSSCLGGARGIGGRTPASVRWETIDASTPFPPSTRTRVLSEYSLPTDMSSEVLQEEFEVHPANLFLVSTS